MSFCDSDASEMMLNVQSVLSDDLSGSSTGYARGPERALLTALLFDGVQGFIHYSTAGSHKARGRHSEAYRWVTEERSDYVFSFENVCEALGVNSAYLRCGLLNTCTAQLTKAGQARRCF